MKRTREQADILIGYLQMKQTSLQDEINSLRRRCTDLTEQKARIVEEIREIENSVEN